MDLKLKVIGNAAAIQAKQERGTDGTVKTTDVKSSRISARDENQAVLQFTVDYEEGKAFELGKELTVTIQ